jgi:hypothetical protein
MNALLKGEIKKFRQKAERNIRETADASTRLKHFKVITLDCFIRLWKR